MSDTYDLVRTLYKDGTGNPILLTPTQDQIFAAIAKKLYNRLHIMCHTRYGKSLTVALAVLTRVATFPEKWAIFSGTKDRARIIMDYIIQHIFDNDFTAKRFLPEKGDRSDDAIRKYRNKNRLTFKVGEANGKSLYGEVFIGTASEAIGQGAPNVIAEESSLFNAREWAMVARMVGDDPKNNFLCQIGNPFERNHFLEAYHDPAYHKININCYKSLAEGRISQEIIDANRGNLYFRVLFENIFPSSKDIDVSGWQYLLTDTDINKAQTRDLVPKGVRRMGVDVARGGRNFSVWVMRMDNYAKVLEKINTGDLIGRDETVGDAEVTVKLMREHGIQPQDVFIDDTGVGGGLTDYLKHMGYKVNPVVLGESVEDEECVNVRSSIYAGKEGLAVWIKGGGKLEPHKDWLELTKIRYKKKNGIKTLIESKDDMRKAGLLRTGESPDVADALALTFANSAKSVYYGVDPQAILSGGVTYR